MAEMTVQCRWLCFGSCGRFWHAFPLSADGCGKSPDRAGASTVKRLSKAGPFCQGAYWPRYEIMRFPVSMVEMRFRYRNAETYDILR